MEILCPSRPPSPMVELHLRGGRGTVAAAAAASSAWRADHAEPLLHVAVGRSAEKTLALLRWSFRRFDLSEIVLVHVHQPSPMMPTPLGNIPVSQADDDLLVRFRRFEIEEMKKILQSYKAFCERAQVQTNVILHTADQVHDGLVDVINKYWIRRLVVGLEPDSGWKLRPSSSKYVNFVRKVTPLCEMLFVSKGRVVWTREASPGSAMVDTSASVNSSLSSGSSEFFMKTEHISGMASPAIAAREGRSLDNAEIATSEMIARSMDPSNIYSCTTSSTQDLQCPSTSLPWPDLPSETPENLSQEALDQVIAEGECLKKTAFLELVKCKELESKVKETYAQMEAFKSQQLIETTIKEELEGILASTKKQHEDIVHQRDLVMREFDNAMRELRILDNRVQEVNLSIDTTTAELELIQYSIDILQHEEQKFQRQNANVDLLFASQRCCNQIYSLLCNTCCMDDDPHSFTEFTLSDLQAATCGFSENFSIGRADECVYKGEIMGKSVAVKKLHSHGRDGLKEFQQEVYFLSKFRHPHLMTLIGACPENLCLVYEYMPNGTLYDRLFSKATSLPWNIRTRITTEIARALLFLHSCKPEKIVHGNLKLENILLDADLHSKIYNFSVCQALPEETVYSPWHCRRSASGMSFHADPEFQRTMMLTPKTDVYSFGIIVLQLLTGKASTGLANEVRQALSSGKLSSVLDTTAGEWPAEVARRFAEIGLQFSESISRDRPDITPDLVRDLERLHLVKERQVPASFLCPILKEIMHDPQVLADGFTYEGWALREWLASGKDTSPTTYLKLKHLNLTPNHNLRFAIQDWLIL